MLEKKIPLPPKGGPESLNQTDFFASMIGELSGLLEEVVGLQDAEGFISTVGSNLGQQISRNYPIDSTKPEQIAAILVDLKTRINGNFSMVSADGDTIVLTASRCPFGNISTNRPSLCMMTTNVFGRIVADRNGYAHVHVDKAISRGDPGCRIVVSLKLDNATPQDGLEFFPE